MAGERNTTGLSRDFIIHPGETVAEVIEDRGMTQRELAIRTGMTEKHISTVIHGQKGISAAFAKKLEYALGIEAGFWMNLQANYERELFEFEEVNSISEEEIGVLRNLKEVVEVYSSFGWIDKETNPPGMVVDFRRAFGVSNLLDTPKIPYVAAYRAQSRNTGVDPYVLFAWQRMCELMTRNQYVADEVDVEKLRECIPTIKQTMFLRANLIQKKLLKVFSECGIAFRIVPHFTGAPVQGFIKKTEGGTLILCVTLRQKFADIFWFTLFHEIAHILNGDMKHEFIDFDSEPGEMEDKADKLARNLLIDEECYKKFIATEEFTQSDRQETFAKSQNVQAYIVQGRLMKDGLMPWRSRVRYDWA